MSNLVINVRKVYFWICWHCKNGMSRFGDKSRSTHTHTHTDCVHVQLKRIVTTGSVKFRKAFPERFHLRLMAGVYSGSSAESSPVYGGDCLQIQWSVSPVRFHSHLKTGLCNIPVRFHLCLGAVLSSLSSEITPMVVGRFMWSWSDNSPVFKDCFLWSLSDILPVFKDCFMWSLSDISPVFIDCFMWSLQ